MKTITFRQDFYRITKNVNEALILCLLFEYEEKLKNYLSECVFSKQFILDNIIIEELNIDLYLNSLIKKNLVKEEKGNFLLTLENLKDVGVSSQDKEVIKDTIDKKLDFIKTKWNEIAKVQGFSMIKSFSGQRKAQWKRILSKHPSKSFWTSFFAILSDVRCKWLAEATIKESGLKWFNIDFFYKDMKVDRVEKFVEGFYLRECVKNTTGNMYKDKNQNKAVEQLVFKNEIIFEG